MGLSRLMSNDLFVATRSASGEPPGPAKPFEMICDKPFVFILYRPTRDGRNQVLFTGAVNQPQS